MTENQATGVWSYTTPMPSGTYTYGFYVNCTAAAPALTGCTELSDPSNPPWNTTGSIEPDSQIYVPSDKKFGTPDMSWEKPHPKQGQLIEDTYTSPQSTNPVGTHPLAVFLPRDTTRPGRSRTRPCTSATAAVAMRSTGPRRAPPTRSWTT